MGRKKYRKERIKKLIPKLKKFKESNKIQKLILFGSYGRGDFTKRSDVDIILIDKKFRDKNVFERTKGLWLKWHLNLKINYPVDFICYTPEEFNKLKKEVSIASEALKEGIEV